MINWQAMKSKFLPMRIYSYRETLKLLCPTQSSTASHLLTEMLILGLLQETKVGYRVNI